MALEHEKSCVRISYLLKIGTLITGYGNEKNRSDRIIVSKVRYRLLCGTLL